MRKAAVEFVKRFRCCFCGMQCLQAMKYTTCPKKHEPMLKLDIIVAILGFTSPTRRLSTRLAILLSSHGCTLPLECRWIPLHVGL